MYIFVSTIYHKEKCTYSTSTIFQALENMLCERFVQNDILGKKKCTLYMYFNIFRFFYFTKKYM